MHGPSGRRDPLAELRQQLQDYPGWHGWVGISGIIYARKPRTSPPAVFRGATPEAVARQVKEWEASRR